MVPCGRSARKDDCRTRCGRCRPRTSFPCRLHSAQSPCQGRQSPFCRKPRFRVSSLVGLRLTATFAAPSNPRKALSPRCLLAPYPLLVDPQHLQRSKPCAPAWLRSRQDPGQSVPAGLLWSAAVPRLRELFLDWKQCFHHDTAGSGYSPPYRFDSPRPSRLVRRIQDSGLFPVLGSAAHLAPWAPLSRRPVCVLLGVRFLSSSSLGQGHAFHQRPDFPISSLSAPRAARTPRLVHLRCWSPAFGHRPLRPHSRQAAQHDSPAHFCSSLQPNFQTALSLSRGVGQQNLRL